MENYLDTLNPSQRAAVEYCDGPQLVIAGAGSGKTRVLTMKIAYLLQHGYQPDGIMALTFTKKAATEMQNRIQTLVGTGLARRLWMGTFHSLFSRILRREAVRLGFRSDFTIYDQQDSRNLIKTIIKEMGLDEKQYKPASVHNQISNAKNNLITPGMYAANRELMLYDAQAQRPKMAEIYQQYWNRCYLAGAMDFDDLLLYTNILFRDHPDLLEYYQDYFKYVLVDEYQDTNRAQHLIVEQLVRKHNHLCVVGDDAQSIYSFRGANIRNILDLRQQIPGTRLFKLEQNYRSTQNIVEAANSLIAKNKEQIRKTIFSEKERGSLLRLTGCFSDLEEATRIVKMIRDLHDRQNYAYHDCAVLYRNNFISRVFEDELRKNSIGYRIYGGLSFYQRKEIKDVIAMLRLLVNPADEESFKRVIRVSPFGIGETTLGKLVEALRTAVAEKRQTSLFGIASDPDANGVKVNSRTRTSLAKFVEAIVHCREFSKVNNVHETTAEILRRLNYKESLNDGTIEAMSKTENVNELLDSIKQSIESRIEQGEPALTLTEYLSTVSLDEPESDSEDPSTDRVALMSIHQAKGLEFKNVFIVAVEDGILPSEVSIGEIGGREEERRLFYVAITRAEENCFLSYAKSRFHNGRSEQHRASDFIRDIDRRYVQEVSTANPLDYGSTGGGSFASFSRPYPGSSQYAGRNSYAGSHTYQSSRQEADVAPVTSVNSASLRRTAPASSLKPQATLMYGGRQLTVGTRIVHDRFGKGVITALSGKDESARI
ncbi:MAG: UvrD-helicase domain-containing protein [Bacteroidales bacterium]|nr:UvrD-helicase domain-containing protein [Bacteroidales bacterium]